MGYFGQSIDPDFSPRQVYHLINGKAFPDTDVIEARAGDDVLLRYVNAGVSDKTMGVLGLRKPSGPRRLQIISGDIISLRSSAPARRRM